MKCLFIFGFHAVAVISSCIATDLIIGSNFNNHLTWQQKAEYAAVPLFKRVKEVFYSDPGQQIIKSIVAKDVDHTGASATVTAGGVGFSFVNIRLKSDRGSGLNYQIEIYV